MMSRKVMFLLLIVVLVAAFPATALAKGPAEKATGDVGYTAFGLQRYAVFNAHEGIDDCSGGWNLVGNWVLDFYLGGGTWTHDMMVSSQTDGTLSGTGGYPAGGPYSHPWTMTGTVSGNNVSLTIVYVDPAPNPGYTVRATGTIAMDGTMGGTWSSSIGQNGTWASTSGAAMFCSNCQGKGTFHYSDANGDWYDVDVQYVNVNGVHAYFAGPVTAASRSGWVGNWLSAAVHDGGEPAYEVDHIWGIFTDEFTAHYNVVNEVAPGQAFAITSGNLQVHTYDG